MPLLNILTGRRSQISDRTLEALSEHCVWHSMLRAAAKIAADATASLDESQRAEDAEGYSN